MTGLSVPFSRPARIPAVATAADDDHAAVSSEQLQIMTEVDVGEHFEDEVYTQPAGRFQNLFPIVRLRVIEDMVCAFTHGQFEAFLRARRA